mmetsp:Transcript_23456/g.44691  ORF Transcript_23456/g.44691 Transcript_23456/m.44691 type:complete len:145 (+) Transcript_23456:808-1242(+)
MGSRCNSSNDGIWRISSIPPAPELPPTTTKLPSAPTASDVTSMLAELAPMSKGAPSLAHAPHRTRATTSPLIETTCSAWMLGSQHTVYPQEDIDTRLAEIPVTLRSNLPVAKLWMRMRPSEVELEHDTTVSRSQFTAAAATDAR